MIESKEEFNYLLKNLKAKKKENRLGASLQAKLQAFQQVEGLINLPISAVVSSAFLVQHKETLINYGLFSTREKAENYIKKNTDLFGIQEVKIA